MFASLNWITMKLQLNDCEWSILKQMFNSLLWIIYLAFAFSNLAFFEEKILPDSFYHTQPISRSLSNWSSFFIDRWRPLCSTCRLSMIKTLQADLLGCGNLYRILKFKRPTQLSMALPTSLDVRKNNGWLAMDHLEPSNSSETKIWRFQCLLTVYLICYTKIASIQYIMRVEIFSNRIVKWQWDQNRIFGIMLIIAKKTYYTGLPIVTHLLDNFWNIVNFILLVILKIILIERLNRMCFLY